MTVTTSSRNPGVRKLIEADGDEETKAYVRNYYGIPDSVTDWEEIDKLAEMAQAEMNKK